MYATKDRVGCLGFWFSVQLIGWPRLASQCRFVLLFKQFEALYYRVILSQTHCCTSAFPKITTILIFLTRYQG